MQAGYTRKEIEEIASGPANVQLITQIEVFNKHYLLQNYLNLMFCSTFKLKLGINW